MRIGNTLDDNNNFLVSKNDPILSSSVLGSLSLPLPYGRRAPTGALIWVSAG